MKTDRIHEKFRYYFGSDYKKADLVSNCKFILRHLGLTTKNPVEEIKRNWSKVCQFLIDWNGEPKKHIPMNLGFEKFVNENFIYEKESGFWFHKDAMTSAGSEPYNKKDIARLYKERSITKKNITPEQELMFAGKICPYCKKQTEYIADTSELWRKNYGAIYICRPCNSWVGTHKGEPTKALGRLANAELRELKKEAHDAFDPIWKSNYKSRHEAYQWLSDVLKIPKEYTHIGFFGVETCKKVVEICTKEMQ